MESLEPLSHIQLRYVSMERLEPLSHIQLRYVNTGSLGPSAMRIWR